MKKNFTLFLFAFFLLIKSGLAQTCAFKLFHPGAASDNFSSIVADKQGHIWAGTDREGLYRYENGTWVKAASLQNNTINQMAVDKNGGLWVAQSGTGGNNGPAGGLDYFPSGSLTSTRYFFSFINNDRPNYGLPSTRMQSVTVDSKGVVWAGGTWSYLNDGTTYLHNPGGLSRLLPGADRFKEVNYDAANLPEYPGIRGTLDITQSGCIRNCLTLTSGKREVLLGWVGNGDCAIPAKINKYRNTVSSTNTTVIFSGAFTNTNSPLPFTLAVRPVALFIDKNENVWAGLNNGNGFAVYSRDSSLKDNAAVKWIMVKDSLPAGTVVNPHAIAGGESSQVAIGTNNGLYIYNGEGDFKNLKNYSVYTTGNSNLPSNNVKGVAFDGNGNVWAATDHGIVQLPLGNLEMFALKPKSSTLLIDYSDGTERYSVFKFKSNGCNINEDDIPSVAADGSGATLFIWKGENVNAMQFRIKEDANGQDPDQYGRFLDINRNTNNDSIKVKYFHPKYVDGLYTVTDGIRKKITLEVYNPSDNNKVVFTTQLKIELPPVLLVHGVWSSKLAFTKLLNYLKTNGIYKYKDYQVNAIGYENPEHFEFAYDYYRYWIKDGIDELQKQCAENHLSIGKADVIAHSRGGLFARQYIQGTYTDYRKDIDKLITLNTPHSGSQTANLILDPRKITVYTAPPVAIPYKVELGAIMRELPVLESYDDPSGAKQLRVDDDEIVNVINGTAALQRERDAKVPTHAVATRYKFGVTAIEKTVVGAATGGVAGFLVKGFIKKMGVSMWRKLVMYYGTKQGASFGAKYSLEKLFDEGLVDYVLRKVYNGEINDIIVPWSSQVGGIDTSTVKALSKFDEGVIAHSSKDGKLANISVYGLDYFINNKTITGVPDAQQVHFKLLDLLRAKASGELFSNKGFNPPKLSYDFLKGVLDDGRTTNARTMIGKEDSIRIVSVTPASEIHGGDLVKTLVKGGSGIKSMLIEYTGNNTSYGSDFTDNNNSTFEFPVPKEATGSIKITAYGYSDSALVSVDTFNIETQLPAGVTLQSIKIKADADDMISVPAKETIPLTILGYYSDTVRDITHMTGLSYSFDAGAVASVTQPNFLNGLMTGEDILKVSYQGKEAIAFIEVTDSVSRTGSTLPVNLTSFNGALKNKQVYLYWTTAQERNNRRFEVQYSTDAVHFETIGIVAGKGNSSVTQNYVYPTSRFADGKNYYRLKQVDNDGVSKTSAYILITVNAVTQSSVSLYPNPAHSSITLSVKQPVGTRLQLSLTNMAGQQVLSKQLAGGDGSIPVTLPSLAKGMYIVTVLNEKKETVFSSKLVIR